MAKKTKESTALAVPETAEEMHHPTPVLVGGVDGALGGASGGVVSTALKPWKWTRKKRKAVRLLLKGLEIQTVAKELGVYRGTVRRWLRTPEFHAETLALAHEYSNRKRFRRVYETGLLADNIAAEAAKGIKKMSELGDDFSNAQMGKLQMLLREYHAFRAEERQDFGDNVQRVEGHFTVGLSNGLPVNKKAESASSQRFREFLEQHANLVPERVLQSTDNPVEALVGVTREIVRQTNILDDIHDEDRAEQDADAKRRSGT